MVSELDKFLKERSRIRIPSGDVARIRLLAKELALGAHRQLWDDRPPMKDRGRFVPSHPAVMKYFEVRWSENDFDHLYMLLQNHGFVDDNGKLTTKAFDLLDETEPYNIFISYRRLDSSALALLVLARLKEYELVPFVDMALEAGGNWHTDLEERIKGCDYFIILLGKETLSSPMTVKEIQWAIRYKKTIIPIWHSGFKLHDDESPDIPTSVRDAIQQTNAIIVHDESASGYNSAIVELLNRFGVTP